MALVRDDVAVRAYRQLVMQIEEESRQVLDRLRRLRELRKTLKEREAYLPHLQF